jgi:hypothetical protein
LPLTAGLQEFTGGMYVPLPFLMVYTFCMTPEQVSLSIALAIKPFAAIAILTALLGVRFAIIKYMPDSKLKRLLLIRVSKRRN